MTLLMMTTTRSLTAGTVVEVAEALVTVGRARHTHEAVTSVDQQSAPSSTTHERRLTGHSRVQSRRIHDAISRLDGVHRQLVVHRST